MRILTLLFLLACTAFAQKPMFHNCPPEGTWKTEEDKALNTLKNRWVAPSKAILPGIILREIVEPIRQGEADDSKRFKNDDAAALEGYITDLKFEGPEGCNCESKAVDERNFHIWFGLTPTAKKRECMVVEITPRWREARGWTRDQIHGWKGKHVKVTGWLFFDPKHSALAVNSNPSGKLLARATSWEVHPVCKVEILP